MNIQNAEDKTKKTKRIASNTLVLFARMFAIMVINLYAVRVVLGRIGAIDYGTYNAVAGVVLTGSFLITTLAIAIQRFYSYALGENSTERLTQIFTASMNIILLLIPAILLVFETVGVWFVNTQLSIPSGQMGTALWILQFATATLIFSFLQIPFTAAIFAHEDMGIYALISLCECVGKLVVALLIGNRFVSDNLLFYGAGLLVVAALVFSAYALYARFRYQECHYCRHVDKGLYKELLSFSGWTTYSALSGMSVIHGNTILLNIFFGPIATTSYAIANQIHNAMTAVGNSIVIAFRPAMVKAYAQKDEGYLDTLFYVSNKAILYLMLSVSVPLVVEMPVILSWWLGAASGQMVLFSRLFVVFMILMMMQAPITTIVQSSGRIGNYTMLVDSVTLLCLPVTWLLYHLGCPDLTCFVSMLGIYSLAHIIRLVYLHRHYPFFSYRQYASRLALPSTIIVSAALLLTLAIHRQTQQLSFGFFIVVGLSLLSTLLLAYLIGLTKTERHMLLTSVANIIKRKTTC